MGNEGDFVIGLVILGMIITLIGCVSLFYLFVVKIEVLKFKNYVSKLLNAIRGSNHK